MIGLDTNVLLRYVVQDDPEQAAAAERLVETRCTRESPGMVSDIVLAELVWVLRGAYGYEKKLVVSVLRQILKTTELTVKDSSIVWAALSDYERGGADFADCLIGHGNHGADCDTNYTFNKNAAGGRHFDLVE